MLRESIKMSWQNIINNKMRSFLTMLGIVIGVASIIALITIVQGATSEITNQFSALGVDKLTIEAPGTALKTGLNENDLNNLSQIDFISGISPTVSGSATASFNGVVMNKLSLQGKNEVYFNNNLKTMAEGRTINSLDVSSSNLVAVLGSDVAKKLFYGKDPVGESININGRIYTVIGLLKPVSGFTFSSTNKQILVPYTSAMKTLGIRTIAGVDLYMSDSTKSASIITDIEKVLNEAFNYNQDAYSIFNLQQMLDAMAKVMNLMAYLLAGIASISLLVGGIGIMNMMLVSVTERTSEIGLRKALGAEPYRIQLQFLLEAVFMSILGGLAGVLLGLGIALLASILMKITFHITITTLLLSVGFSAAVGIIFGLAPARKASRLNPIDALRHI